MKNKTPRPIKTFRVTTNSENYLAYLRARIPNFELTAYLNKLIYQESIDDQLYNPQRDYRRQQDDNA
jgi:hypothetical protein